MNTNSFYSKILKSSYIMGGAAVITLLLGMIRNKFIAVLIGSTGVGVVAGLTAIQGVIGTIAGLGIQLSVVRQISAADSNNDEMAIGRAVLTLRRVCWLSGLVGMASMIAFSSLLSQLTFNSEDYSLDVALTGIIILLVNLTGGQLALLQGLRRIGDLANANIGGAIFATLSAIGFYYWLGLRGIVPSLISIALSQLIIGWYFASQAPVQKVFLTWKETFSEANDLIKMGLVFMLNGLMLSAVSFLTITFISRKIDLNAVGLYSAAFALSGMFVNFVLGAMSADYFPQLTGLANNKVSVNQLVNEQTEIGLLLSIPGLLATLVLAPWILQVFYTQEFLGAVELMQWFVLGCLGRVISWPLGYVMLALGKGRWFLVTETCANITHLALVILGLELFGIQGVGIAFFVMNLGYIMIVNRASYYLTNFKWSDSCRKIMLITFPVLFLTFVICRMLPTLPTLMIGLMLTFISSIFCLLGLVQRVDSEHRIVRLMYALPGVKCLLRSVVRKT